MNDFLPRWVASDPCVALGIVAAAPGLEVACTGVAWCRDRNRRLSLILPLLLVAVFEFSAFSSSAASPSSTAVAVPASAPNPDIWALAQRHRSVHRFSTLYTAQNVREHLSSEAGLREAIDWCKRTAVSKVYLEEFRDGYTADRATLVKAREAFVAADIEASGCITTTRVGKDSTGWKAVSCYTDSRTQEKLKSVFEYAASLFDEIMIDDFWFTDCQCADCQAARSARTVTIGTTHYPVAGDTWEDYRCELLVQLSRHYILEAARKVNPKVKVIIKYPQWYDRFQDRGYDVARETVDFDRIWVGTETRDYTNKQWGGTVPFEAFFIMRWLGGVGGAKCGGGWFDPYGTTPPTYLEQARQTILAGARESMLFCYGSLQQDTGPKNIERLRANLPELFATAGEVARRHPAGIAAYKPLSSHPGDESVVFDFVGMLGLPLVPCHEFPTQSSAAFFSVHALKDPDFAAKLQDFIKAGKPVLLTDGLVKALGEKVDLHGPGVHVLSVKGEPKSLLKLTLAELEPLRAAMLKSVGVEFRAPNKIGLYLFTDGSCVIENFNEEPIEVQFNGKSETVPARGWSARWK
jgi:hypothetical protein